MLRREREREREGYNLGIHEFVGYIIESQCSNLVFGVDSPEFRFAFINRFALGTVFGIFDFVSIS